MRSHTLAPNTICIISHSVCGESTDRSGSHKLSHLRLSSFVVCLWSQKGNFDVSPKSYHSIGRGVIMNEPTGHIPCIYLCFRLTICMTRVMICNISLSGNSSRHLLSASMKGEHCFWSSRHHTSPMGQTRSMLTRQKNAAY